MYSFDQIACKINNSGVLAESASISSQNTLIPVYQIGKRGNASITPQGPLTNTFQFSYTPTFDYDAGYLALNELKDLLNDSNFTGATIELAGITGFNCYLENYSLNVEPNSFVKAQASYVSYLPLSGGISTRNPSENPIPTHNVGHSWSTFIATTGYYLLAPTFSFDYNFRAKWEPTYRFGDPYPQQVNFLGAEEQITLIRDRFTHVKFTGQDAYNNETGYFAVNSGLEDPNISLINVALHCHLHPQHGSIEDRFSSFKFNISGAKITNSELNAQVDDYLRGTTTIVNYY